MGGSDRSWIARPCAFASAHWAVMRDRIAARQVQLIRYRSERDNYTTERLEMGTGSYGEPLIPTFPGDDARVRVGRFVSIAADVVLGDGGDHRTDWVSTYPFRARFDIEGGYRDGHPRTRGDVDIGNDVWIGRGAIILGGVSSATVPLLRPTRW